MDHDPLHNPLHKALREKLDGRRQKSTFRQLTVLPSNSVDFSSNDFLSLAGSDEFRNAYIDALTTAASSGDFHIGSGGARLLDGNSSAAEELERTIAAFHRAPAGLLWNTGFDANSGFFACVPQPGDVILYDELIHASAHEGMKLTRAARCIPFRHNSITDVAEQLERLVKEVPGLREARHNVIIAVESVYSMDGDLAPLADIVKVVDEWLPAGNGHIVVDEAHATGVIGPQGRGLVCELGLEQRVFARLHTFGKALGCSGAIILCSPIVKSYLINYARPFIYTTAMTYPSLIAIKVAYSLLQTGHTEKLAARLRYLIRFLYKLLTEVITASVRPVKADRRIRIAAVCPQSPIFSLLTESPRGLARHCQKANLVIRPIVPPTVPTRRVRICLHAKNTENDIKLLVARINDWMYREDDEVVGDGEQQATDTRPRL